MGVRSSLFMCVSVKETAEINWANSYSLLCRRLSGSCTAFCAPCVGNFMQSSICFYDTNAAREYLIYYSCPVLVLKKNFFSLCEPFLVMFYSVKGFTYSYKLAV